MAYIPLNQIVDALEELEPLQKQLLLRILEETTSSTAMPAHKQQCPLIADFQTWMRFEPLDFAMDLYAHAAVKQATSRKTVPTAGVSVSCIKTVATPLTI